MSVPALVGGGLRPSWGDALARWALDRACLTLNYEYTHIERICQSAHAFFPGAGAHSLSSSDGIGLCMSSGSSSSVFPRARHKAFI